MAPYYPWKLTHTVHHKNTNNIDKDEVFYPARGRRGEPTYFDQILLWFPGLGWFYYLWFGYRPRAVNHYNLVGFLSGNRSNATLFSLFKFEPLFYNKHIIGVGFSLGAYATMVEIPPNQHDDIPVIFLSSVTRCTCSPDTMVSPVYWPTS